MPHPGPNAILLNVALPSLCTELQELLERGNEPKLASQVSSIVDRCRCGDDFCASLYTEPTPSGAYGPGHSCLEERQRGMIIFDILYDKIAGVGVLPRDEGQSNAPRHSSIISEFAAT
jgi:hypothetical protein